MRQRWQTDPVSGEFLVRETESEYRESCAVQEQRQIRRIWVFALLFFAAYAPLDALLLVPAQPLCVLVPRLLIAGAAGAALWWLPRCRDFLGRDRVGCLALLFIAPCYAWILLARGGADVGASALLVVGSYVFSPSRFWLSVINGVAFLVAALVVAAEVGTHVAWLSASFLLPANLLAAMVMATMNRLARAAYAAQQRSDAVLFDALPRPIAEQLKQQPGRMLAREVREATIIFTDLVGFTRLARRLTPSQVTGLLNQLFARFDDLVGAHGVEKIKTLGDAYMAVGGVTSYAKGQQDRIAAMALAQLQACRELEQHSGVRLNLRIGIHSGPMLAGVIGVRRPQFDVWGDTVNTASRLQVAASPGRILVSERFRRRCGQAFLFSPSVRLELRGCGALNTCQLFAQVSDIETLGDRAGDAFR